MELFWFVLFSFISSSFATSDVRIVNGTSAEIGEFPFVVSLENKGRHFCGGTVLNKKYILTAAHCVCDVSLVDLTVHLTHYLDNPQEKIPIKSIICNENYSDMEHINDVAILEMEGQVPDHLYHPVKLVSQNFACETDLNGTLVGWGLTEDGFVPNVLRKVDVVVYSDSDCSVSHFGMYDMEKNMCAGWPENGKGSCQGDSGGPLLIEGFQAGIISFGISSNCGISSREQPKVLARISKYVDWIRDNSEYEEDVQTDDGSDVTLHGLSFCVLLLACFC
ncbi:chymotrypsin-2-like [Tenebrio molitor]|uniref:chymotrypsin-2-like n=1 Tax=Tenebrio molitor TaxID=7067 RepID=UPI003624ABAA